MVRKLALELPGVEPGTMYGSPAVKLRGNLLACIAVNKSAEANTLAIVISFTDRDLLIADDPDVYYLKDHYVGYPCVLVRLSRIHPDALRDLLRTSWRFVSEQARRTRRRPPRATDARRRRAPGAGGGGGGRRSRA